MNIVIDLTSVGGNGGVANPFVVLLAIVSHGGWIVLIPVLLWGAFRIWVNYRQLIYKQRMKNVLLAIDVPKENEQSPKAVEQIFAHLAGIQKNGNLRERYIDGYVQPNLSLELVSIEGYVQFLIYTPEKFRDLVEAAFYAQYPNAEVTEVDDYSLPFRPQFPNEEFNIWGSEIKLTNKEYYPIKTYVSFEHSLSQTFFDPMANILEIFSRLGRGEQVWMQILIRPPRKDTWREAGVKAIKKLIGMKASQKNMNLMWLPSQVVQGIYESAVSSIVAPTGFGETKSKQDNAPASLMQHLPPHERTVVEQVGMKLSKFGYESKIRLIYLGKHDVFNKDRVAAFTGSLRQFSTLDMNGFTVDKKTKTSVDYFFVKHRNNARRVRVLRNYRNRSIAAGRNRYALNIEELATLYHFPVTTVVKAPRVQKTESKRGEPPTALPVETAFARRKPFAPGQPAPSAVVVSESAPSSAPVTDTAIVEPSPISPSPPLTPRGSAPPNLPV